jgi:hypothetical protein
MGDSQKFDTWSEQDRIDDSHARSRDASRLGTGLNPFAVRGRCRTCPRPLIGPVEAANGICTDCNEAA